MSPQGNRLLCLAGSRPWLVIPQKKSHVSVEQHIVWRGSTRPAPTLPRLLLPGALLAKLFPAFLLQNNIFCYPRSLGLKGKPSTFKESLFAVSVTSMLTERGSQLWHNALLTVVTGSRETWLLAIVLDMAGGLGTGTY